MTVMGPRKNRASDYQQKDALLSPHANLEVWGLKYCVPVTTGGLDGHVEALGTITQTP